MKQYYVYIVASKPYGTLYIGVTSDLARRIWEHKNKTAESFTKEYDIGILVYYEVYSDPESAITREKRMKKWNREWKINRIREMNPDWLDLYEKLNV